MIMKTSELIKIVMKDPAILDDKAEHMDQLLMAVVKLEKRHLYGLESTSDIKRRDELMKLLTREFSE